MVQMMVRSSDYLPLDGMPLRIFPEGGELLDKYQAIESKIATVGAAYTA